VTVQEMITEIWDATGRFDDLNPYSDPPTNSTFSIATTGAQRILGYINRGYKAILFWRFPSGAQIVFPSTQAKLYFTTNTITGTISSSGDNSIVVDTISIAPDDDLFNGWLLEITGGTGEGQFRTIIDTDLASSTITVAKNWDTTPDATSEFTLYHHEYKVVNTADTGSSYHIAMSSVNTFYAPQTLHDLNNQRTLNLSPNQWSMSGQRLNTGIPSVFFWDQGSIWFDVAPDTGISYELEYRYVPADLTTATESPSVPEPWHMPIVYWAMHEVYRRHQESNEAYAVKRDLQDMMNTIVQPGELAYDKVYGIMEVAGYGNDN